MSSGLAGVLGRIAELQARFPVTPVATPAGVALSPAASARAAAGFDDVLAAETDGLAAPGSASGLPGDLDAPTGASAGGEAGAPVVAAAQRYLGVPYLWGGTDPARGLDCSGLVQRVFADLGVRVPRVAADQARAGAPVAGLVAARPGDLLFFDNSSARAGIDHVAIYLGGGRMLESPRPGLSVREAGVPGEPVAIRRILAEPAVQPAGVGAGGGSYGGLFAAAERRYGLPAGLLAAVARAESGLRADAVSPAGAQGLMQLMPATARGLGVDPFDPAQAVDGAGRLLARNLRDFGSVDLALAAYNAGPGAVRRYGGIPPYGETQAYVRRVLHDLGGA